MILAAADLTPDTTITIGAASAIIVAIVSASAWLHSVIVKVNGSLQAVAVRIKSLEEARAGTYTLAAAAEVALRQAIENPGHRVPDPRDPNRIIEVREGQCRDHD